jgi:hypothetical protein
VLELLNIVSTLTLRSFSRLGSSMSVLDFLHLGSSLSLCSFARLGSTISVMGEVKIGGLVTVQSGSSKSFSTAGTGGTLHGVWSSDNIISASDRRLKRDILPLDQILSAEMRKAHPEGDSGHKQPVPDTVSEGSQAVSWILRELRPVSFTFRRGPESKFARYGFVAQELERVLPTVVREKDDYKHVQYQDLIALLTLTAQSQQDRLDSLERKVYLEQQERRFLQDRLEKLERLIDQLTDTRS